VAASGGPSSRTIARIFLTLVAMAAGLYLLFLVRSVVGLLAISLFLTIALGPAVDFFTRHGLGRARSILLTYVCIGLGVVGVGLLVVPPIVSQVNAFAKHLPQYIDDAQKNKTVQRYDKRYHITKKLKEQAAKVPSRLGKAAGALQSVTVGVFTAAIQLVTVLTLTFFLLLEGKPIFEFLVNLFGKGREEQLRVVSGDVYRAVAGYVAGNVIISLIAGLVTYATLEILGVPFAVPLAVLMAFLDLIPLVGATIGGVFIALVTLFGDFPTDTIVWLVVFVVYQQIENNVIQPVVYRRTVNVHPLIVIVSILVGSTLLGVLGALVAIPVAATIQIVALDAWERRPPRGVVVAEGGGPGSTGGPPAPGGGPVIATP
jgi:predicted PurR-regulated permease PerM